MFHPRACASAHGGGFSGNLGVKPATPPLWLCAVLLVASLVAVWPSAHAAGVYCDDVDAPLDCLDPVLNPEGSVGAGGISADLDLNIKPDVPIVLADHSPFDGIYQCTVKDVWHTEPAITFGSINGDPSGEIVFMLANIDPNQDRYAGYGRGKFVGDSLTGLTSHQGPFALKVSTSVLEDGNVQVTMLGKIRIKLRAPLAGQAAEGDADVTCASIW